jgi:hypothetical protein
MSEDGRKGLFVLAAVMALALAALIYFLFAVHAPEDQQTSSAAGSQASTTPEMPRVPLVAPPSHIAADETNLCGYGPVKRDAVEGIRAEAAKAADNIFGRLKAKLAASRDERESALGHYLQGSTDKLVRTASGSRDPQVYALAFLSCNYGTAGPCTLLSAAQWAEIEPDNALPWLLVASSAGNDSVTRDQAIYRAANARRFEGHSPNFLAMLQWPDIRDQAPQTRSALADELQGMQTALPMPLYTPFIQFCRDSSVDDATRTNVCSNLSRVLLEDRTMLGFSTGVKLAELAGWPPDEVKALRQKKTEYQAALTAAVSKRTDGAHSDCEEQAAFEQWAADYVRLGDRGVAMKFIEETGSPGDALRRRQ